MVEKLQSCCTHKKQERQVRERERERDLTIYIETTHSKVNTQRDNGPPVVKVWNSTLQLQLFQYALKSQLISLAQEDATTYTQIFLFEKRRFCHWTD